MPIQIIAVVYKGIIAGRKFGVLCYSDGGEGSFLRIVLLGKVKIQSDQVDTGGFDFVSAPGLAIKKRSEVPWSTPDRQC